MVVEIVECFKSLPETQRDADPVEIFPTVKFTLQEFKPYSTQPEEHLKLVSNFDLSNILLHHAPELHRFFYPVPHQFSSNLHLQYSHVLPI
jgi:hypothetical protein